MGALLGADTRRVDVIAERLRGHSQDVQDLQGMAQRAVAELRNAWAGPDFESISRRWEQEAGPRLTDVSAVLSTMAAALLSQAEEQRLASGSTGSPSIPSGPGGRPDDLDVNGDYFADSRSTFINALLVGRQESVGIEAGAAVHNPTPADRVKDHVRLNLAQGDVRAAASLASLTGGNDNAAFELAAGRVEAAADYSVDLDANGDLVASAGASAGAYAGYAASRIGGGNDFANGSMGGKAYMGAQAKADASASVGPDGAEGRLGAEAFAGAKAEVDAGGTLAGVTAAAGAEMSYGVGAHADVDAELSATGVGVSVDLGVTLGIGAGANFDVSVNPHEVMANVGHAAEDVGEGLARAADQAAGFLPW